MSGFTINNIWQHPRYSEDAKSAGEALIAIATILGWERNEMIPDNGPKQLVQLTEEGIVDYLDRNHSGKIDGDDFRIPNQTTYGSIWKFRHSLLILAQVFEVNDSNLLKYIDEPEDFTFDSYKDVGAIPPFDTTVRTYTILHKNRCGVHDVLDRERTPKSPADYLFMSGKDFVEEMDEAFELKEKVLGRFPTLDAYQLCEM
jgi:hypothetical protein